MGKKWGSNEEIRIGDVFRSWIFWDDFPWVTDYYQVTALRGKTQVVLRALCTEFLFQGGSEEDHLRWLRAKQIRPLPGRFLPEKELGWVQIYKKGKILSYPEGEVTAWVHPVKEPDGRIQLVEVGWEKGVCFSMEYPEDWVPRDAEAINEPDEEEDCGEKER